MPSFYQSIPASVRELQGQHLVDAYLRGADVPAKAIVGLERGQLTAYPVPGTWSIQQIVMHLVDSDMVASYRMKRIIAEDNPRLDMYDETAFSKRLSYDAQSATEAAELFRRNRIFTANFLRPLIDADFQRTAQHPEDGALSLHMLLCAYVHHLDHHMKFLLSKRDMVKGRKG